MNYCYSQLFSNIAVVVCVMSIGVDTVLGFTVQQIPATRSLACQITKLREGHGRKLQKLEMRDK